MTLTAYGPHYSRFSSEELKTFIRVRHINSSARDRRGIIHDLREADRNATFRSFDLPPELRNAVYRELLSPPSADDRRVHRHSALLAACHQIHDEADGLFNDVDHAEVAFHVCRRQPRTLIDSVVTRYDPDVYFNGTCIFDAERQSSRTVKVETISWPTLIGKVHALTLKVNLSAGEDTFAGDAAEGRTFNHALLKLYKLLADKCSATNLHVEFSIARELSAFGRRGLLSPVCRIAALVDDPSFSSTDASIALLAEARDGTAHFRHLLLLKDEARLAIKIAGLLCCRLRELRSYEWIVGGGSSETSFLLPRSEVMQDFVARIGREIEAIGNTNTDYMSLDLAMAVSRLKKMTAAKLHGEAKEHDCDVRAGHDAAE